MSLVMESDLEPWGPYFEIDVVELWINCCPGGSQTGFPENKEDWPYIWGENEYVINIASSYIYLVHADNDLLNRQE